MELEFHQLDLRYRDLRIVRPKRLRQLMAELAEAGQQSPVLVTADREPQRYVLIDVDDHLEAQISGHLAG
jgi:hypothetical protein